MSISADRRKVEAREDPQALALVESRARTLREDQRALGAALLQVDRTEAFTFAGCASIGEFGRRCGIGEGETHRLLLLARAVEAEALVAPRVLEGRLSVENAALLGHILTE